MEIGQCKACRRFQQAPRRSITMAKNANTSPRVASLASKQLSNPKSTPAQKSVAAAALNDARNKASTKKK